MERITAIVIAKDEEDQLSDCLESVSWVDEIIVVDTGSKDGTVELARRYTPRVSQIQFEGYGHAKNHGLKLATSEWVLSLDADERISSGLRDEIRDVLTNPVSADGYFVPRVPFFLGRAIRHGGWYPGHVLRFFRKGKGTFNTRRVHEMVVLDGPVRRLKNPILHYTDPNLTHYMRKLNLYTSLSAGELNVEQRRFRLWWLLLRPPFTFLKMYVWKRGFMDGLHGFLLAVLSSLHVFLKYAKLWEISANQRDADTADM